MKVINHTAYNADPLMESVHNYDTEGLTVLIIHRVAGFSGKFEGMNRNCLCMRIDKDWIDFPYIVLKFDPNLIYPYCVTENGIRIVYQSLNELMEHLFIRELSKYQNWKVNKNGSLYGRRIEIC